MECAPTVKAEVENTAFPLTRPLDPRTVSPFLNVTVPVGVPLPGVTAVTVAVNVTDWPNTDGLCEELNAVELPALFTVCDNAAEVLVAYAVLPEYTAVIVWLPTANAEVAIFAFPPLTMADPNGVAPSLNVTVPVIVPGVTEVTVAVKVTVWPNTDGFTDAITDVDVTARTVCVSTGDVLGKKSAPPP
jgi:hypothetical protein